MNNAQQNDAVLVAVLIGLNKACKEGFADEKVRDAQVAAPLLKLVQSPAAPGRTKEAHAWLRCLAIDDLAALRQAGANGAVAQTLGQLVGEDNAEIVPLSVRLAAAKALFSLDYAGVNEESLKTLRVQLLSALVKMTDDVLQVGTKPAAPGCPR